MRQAEVKRKTRETDIDLVLALDGDGNARVDCDDQFLRHMLETLAKYGSMDIEVTATGDNDHHLIEDVAITLGLGLRKAMGDAPVSRIASSLVPMDDALVLVSLDLIDRPYVDIECPDQLFHHFLRSLAMSASITLHVMVMRGMDDHHIVEATFKALGLALKDALRPREGLLSTKDEPEIRSA
jgi:imidazoleglycerol-phosphate dehydratase